jgi:hypothetical protein
VDRRRALLSHRHQRLRRDFERGIVLVNPNADAVPVLLDQPMPPHPGRVDPGERRSSV